MSKEFVCCEQCFEHIGKKNTTAARVWIDLCSLRLKYGEILLFQEPCFPELRALELLGYVTSTDIKDITAVKVKGYLETQDGEQVFCLLEGHHE